MREREVGKRERAVGNGAGSRNCVGSRERKGIGGLGGSGGMVGSVWRNGGSGGKGGRGKGGRERIEGREEGMRREREGGKERKEKNIEPLTGGKKNETALQ